MHDRAKVTAKKPDTKTKKGVFGAPKAKSSQSIGSPVDQILQLQRTIGNQAVMRLLKSGVLQAKLKIGQPGDIYEREADRLAEQVMRMPEPSCSGCGDEGKELIQTKPLAEQITPLVQRQVEEEEEEEEILQAKLGKGQSSSVVAPDLESRINTLNGAGQPLPESTRDYFEPRFGYDFSKVRVHTGAKDAETAQALDARAFTKGRDVVFGSGQYAPETAIGRKVLAHELAHVVQQSKSTDSASLQLQRLTEEQKQENLKSPKYAGNRRLQKAFDNDPLLGIGESGEAVKLVQEGLRDDGFEMPASTKKPSNEMDGGFGAETYETVKKFQAKHGLSVDGAVGRETMRKLDELNLKFKPPPTPAWSPAVNKIDIIDTKSGRAKCFGPHLGKADLNAPGPFNDKDTGELANVHQVHFHLDRGNSSELIPHRFIDATYSHGRVVYPREGPDGPAPHEVCRPRVDKLAVADPPGLKWAYTWDYPFKLDAHFYLLVSDTLGTRIANVEYNVEIEKTDKDNIPNKVNRVYPTRKRDLVRNRDL